MQIGIHCTAGLNCRLSRSDAVSESVTELD